MTISYLGHAIDEAHTDLDALFNTAQTADANAAVALANATAALAALSIVPAPSLGRTVTSLQSYINHSAMLWAGDYGVVGDGVTDDTAALQAALAAAAAARRVLFCGAMVIKITSDVSMAGPGIVFDFSGWGATGDVGILMSGTGFTKAGLVVTESPMAMVVSVYGTGQVLGAGKGAIYFDNIQRAAVQKVRVYNINGFGVCVDDAWDCVFYDISVELCGNADDYALSVIATTNHCQFLKVQAERADKKAIHVGDSVLSCVFNNVHSEQLAADPLYTGWEFSGGANLVLGGRFHAQTGTGKLHLRGLWNSWINVRAEASVDVDLEASVSTGIVVVNPDFSGTTRQTPLQTGQLMVWGGKIGTWSGSKDYLYGDHGHLKTQGNLVLTEAGNGIWIKQGVDATCGRAQLAGGTVTVPTAKASVNMELYLSYRGVSDVAHCGYLMCGNIVPGVSFDINSTNALDDAHVSWVMIERA